MPWSWVIFLRCSENADFISLKGLVPSWPETWASLTIYVYKYEDVKYISNKNKSTG